MKSPLSRFLEAGLIFILIPVVTTTCDQEQELPDRCRLTVLTAGFGTTPLYVIDSIFYDSEQRVSTVVEYSSAPEYLRQTFENRYDDDGSLTAIWRSGQAAEPMPVNTELYSYQYNNGRISVAGGSVCDYDKEGKLVKVGNQSIEYIDKSANPALLTEPTSSTFSSYFQYKTKIAVGEYDDRINPLRKFFLPTSLGFLLNAFPIPISLGANNFHTKTVGNMLSGYPPDPAVPFWRETTYTTSYEYNDEGYPTRATIEECDILYPNCSYKVVYTIRYYYECD